MAKHPSAKRPEDEPQEGDDEPKDPEGEPKPEAPTATVWNIP